MLTQNEESTQEVLLKIGKALEIERTRLFKVRDNLDRIEREHAIIVVKLADRH